MGPRRPNQKAVAANERKDANQAKKDAELRKQQEKQEAAEWKKGSNVKGAERKDAAAQKADEAARKRQEKAALLAAEEEGISTKTVKKPPGGAGAKQKRKKKKDELGLLEDALVGNAEKKSRQAKKAERERKERAERQAAEAAAKKQNGAAAADPLLANTDAMIGGVAESLANDGTNAHIIGRKANVAIAMNGGDSSGVDAALGALSVGGGGAGGDQHPEKRMKALHMAFEERMMPEMKQDYPGLKMSQYKQKIFALWKKSPENPMNAQQR